MSAIDDALADLDSGVEEVTQELNDLADAVEAGEVNTEQVASEIRQRAQRLRDIRPDAPVPAESGDEVPADSGEEVAAEQV